MARTIEKERAQLDAELALLEAGRQKLNQRRRELAERERAELMKEVEKSGLLKGDAEQVRSILGAVKSKGVAEVAKLLAA